MSTMKILSKEEWGGRPARTDVAGEVLTEVALPAKYVLIAATNTRPCVALEDCAILMKTYQEYFHSHQYSDVPFNFMVGPGDVALEGKGWHTNCLDFREAVLDKECAWRNVAEVTGVLHKIPELRRLKNAIGFKKQLKEKKKIQQDVKRIKEKIKEKELKESIGEKEKDDLNEQFGKTIVIGVISNVFCGNPSSRAVSSAFSLIQYGIRNNLIEKDYKLIFNFDPVYKLDNICSPRDSPFLGVMEMLYVYRNRLMGDFVENFMFPSMKSFE